MAKQVSVKNVRWAINTFRPELLDEEERNWLHQMLDQGRDPARVLRMAHEWADDNEAWLVRDSLK
jgi:hypothetical protein